MKRVCHLTAACRATRRERRAPEAERWASDNLNRGGMRMKLTVGLTAVLFTLALMGGATAQESPGA